MITLGGGDGGAVVEEEGDGEGDLGGWLSDELHGIIGCLAAVHRPAAAAVARFRWQRYVAAVSAAVVVGDRSATASDAGDPSAAALGHPAESATMSAPPAQTADPAAVDAAGGSEAQSAEALVRTFSEQERAARAAAEEAVAREERRYNALEAELAAVARRVRDVRI
jgi:hypothetical protein